MLRYDTYDLCFELPDKRHSSDISGHVLRRYGRNNIPPFVLPVEHVLLNYNILG